MTISTEKKVWTDEEFMALSKDGHRYELVNGEVVDMGNFWSTIRPNPIALFVLKTR